MQYHKLVTIPMLLLTLLVIGISLSSCYGGNKNSGVKEKCSFFAMDTYMTLTAYGDHADEAVNAAKDNIISLEKMWSVTYPKSEIFAANRDAKAELSDNTADLVRFALDMCRVSDGALDISIYPVLTAWGFTTNKYRVPTNEELSSLLENIGYWKIKLDGNTLTIPHNMKIDLGSVAKGYAGDLAAQVLRSKGVTSALLDLGGNIQTLGSKPDGSAWRVGIRDPYGDGSLATLFVKDKAVVTSGGYERYFEENNETYWHIIDPKTGKPARSGLVSVTVVGNEGKLCDALSTSLFVMGLDGAIKLWKERDDFEFIIVKENGDVFITDGIENCFKLSENYGRPNVSVIRNVKK